MADRSQGDSGDGGYTAVITAVSALFSGLGTAAAGSAAWMALRRKSD